MPLTITVSSTNCTDLVNPNGTASVTVSGGTAPYSYLWSNGDTTDNIGGLLAGIYTVTVTDSSVSPLQASDITIVDQVSSTLPDQIPQWTYQDIQDKIANLECCAGKIGYDIAYKAFTGQKVCKCDHSGLKYVNRAIEILKGYIPPGTAMNVGSGSTTSLYISLPSFTNILGYVLTYPLGSATYTVIRQGPFLDNISMFNDIGNYLLSVGYTYYSISGNVLYLETDSYNHDGQTLTIIPQI